MRAVAVTGENRSLELWRKIFAGLFGALLGLALLKFGNPVILASELEWPTDGYEWVLSSSWPLTIGYWALAAVALIGLATARWKTSLPWPVLAAPLAWLVWEALVTTGSIEPELSHATLIHFASCVACFYLGLFCLGRASRLWPFWTCLIIGFLLSLAAGLDQHFGGLAETRRLFSLYNPDPSQVDPEKLKRVMSTRIFGTLLLANTFAGVILMLLPMTIAAIQSLQTQVTAGVRWVFTSTVGVAALTCLYWSGSKGGWLVMLFIGLVAGLYLPVSRQIKTALIAGALILGLAGFFLKHAGFFKRGATSVVARFDYWQGAVQAVKEKPLTGSGPGTFGRTYTRLKKPEAEATRLAHNDYLQQASDSGIPGFLLFTAFVTSAIALAYRNTHDWFTRSVWLGTLGWALQSLMEFHLYIPAMAWPAFTFMGWLLSSKPSTSPPNSAKIKASK